MPRCAKRKIRPRHEVEGPVGFVTLMEAYLSCCYGAVEPTRLAIEQSLWDRIFARADRHLLRFNNADVIFLDEPGLAFFVNENQPYDKNPKYNCFIKFTDA